MDAKNGDRESWNKNPHPIIHPRSVVQVNVSHARQRVTRPNTIFVASRKWFPSAAGRDAHGPFSGCESVFDPRSAICHHSFFASIRVYSRFNHLFGRVGAARPRRPTAVEEVGKMPTLLEDTGEPPMPLFEEAASSSSYPVTNDLSQTPRMREISASEIIALKRSSRGAVLRSATVTARSRVNLPERVRRSALRWAPQPSFSPMSWA